MEHKVVVCNLGDQLYGIDINKVRGIEKEQQIVSVPNSAQYIKGIINLRGDIIPIYSLRRKFRMEDVSGVNTQFVIVKVKETPLAIEVDGVGEIYTAEEDAIYNAPKIVISDETRFIDKIVKTNDKLILCMNIEELLTDEERQGIESLIDSCK